MFKKILTVWLLLAGVQIIDAGYFIDEYYVSYPLELNWYAANRFCKYYGMHLIDVPHEEEYNRILGIINAVKENRTTTGMGSIWTSGVRFLNESTYYWETTGQPVIYANWSPSEPDLGSQQCLCLHKRTNYALADAPCENVYAFMCTKILINPLCEPCRMEHKGSNESLQCN